MKVTKVEKARKNYIAVDGTEIKRGMSYYWAKHRNQPRMIFANAPTPQQLTMSPFWSTLYQLQDDQAAVGNIVHPDEWDGAVDSMASVISCFQELRDEVQEAFDNVPEQLQDSHMLNERLEEIEDIMNEFDSLDFDPPMDTEGEIEERHKDLEEDEDIDPEDLENEKEIATDEVVSEFCDSANEVIDEFLQIEYSGA